MKYIVSFCGDEQDAAAFAAPTPEQLRERHQSRVAPSTSTAWLHDVGPPGARTNDEDVVDHHPAVVRPPPGRRIGCSPGSRPGPVSVARSGAAPKAHRTRRPHWRWLRSPR